LSVAQAVRRAVAAGSTAGTIFERGVGDPRLSPIIALARALGVRPAELLNGVR
jgi:hypothetical protein